MAFGNLKWFSRKKDAMDETRQLAIEEFQTVKKLLRKQTIMIEEVRREQEAAAAVRKSSDTEHLIELCDSVFHLYRAFQSPGIMSRQHVQALEMVMKKLERFALSRGLEMILEESLAFDSSIHEAVANLSPESEILDVIEVVQPGYLQSGKLIRPAKVIVGRSGDAASAPEGTLES